MNAPPFPTNPSIGEFYGNWVWNGVRWVGSPAAGVRVVIQTFTASGPYMPSVGLVTALVEMVGGGGGGGGALGTYVSPQGWLVSGGGGGSGGYSRAALAASLVLGGVQITIGQGGAGAAPPTGPSYTEVPPPGGNGTATTFGALVVANGGIGGGSAGPIGGGPGAPAPAGTGDIAVAGNVGHAGQGFYQDNVTGGNITGGSGGASFFGGAGMGAFVATNAGGGDPGTVGGGGGGGGSGSTTAVGGGDGGDGLCIVTEYCWSDSGPPDECLNPPINVNARVAVTHVPWPGPGPCPPGWDPGDGDCG